MQSQQLLPKGEVLQEEFFSGAKDGEDPAEHVLPQLELEKAFLR